MQEIIRQLQKEFSDTVSWFKSGVSSLRTGRATPALVEDLEVEYYGARSLIKHIAALSAPDPHTILIQPWDKNALDAISKAIESSSLNLRPIPDKDSIRLSLPALTEERRYDLIKILHAKAEEARIRSRHAKDEAWKSIQEREKAKEMGEDEKFRAKEQLQKEMNRFNEQIEKIEGEKEEEILER